MISSRADSTVTPANWRSYDKRVHHCVISPYVFTLCCRARLEWVPVVVRLSPVGTMRGTIHRYEGSASCWVPLTTAIESVAGSLIATVDVTRKRSIKGVHWLPCSSDGREQVVLVDVRCEPPPSRLHNWRRKPAVVGRPRATGVRNRRVGHVN